MKPKYILTAFFLISVLMPSVSAQIKLTQDTMSTPIVGFSFGTIFASDKLSTENGMYDLYKGPYLNYGIETGYKFKSNWLLLLDGNLTIGNELRDPSRRMPAAFSHDSIPIVIGTNGTDANATCYNRALSLRVGGGKIFTLTPKNPNSGLLLAAYAGILQQKTIFVMNDVNAPQLQDDYARLYDHKRRGFTLTESIGYWFMSNKANFFNFHITFEVTQCWNHSVRDYIIDEVMDLHGPDNTKYFDLLYTVRLTWMFPLKGKTAYDYYFF
ncbi:MAG: hypothetical protein J6031_04580 [Bacteroidales bacterium]|nr:hypothetical protein [Bacteroidales bacterium]